MPEKLNCVLLIDDNENDNYYHMIVLKEADIAHHIHVAESGSEALDYLNRENQTTELIFLDINMPTMSGWEFLEKYTKLSPNKKAQTVIIMLTTSLNPADRKKAQEASVNGFELKPLTTEIIQRILKEHFQTKTG